MEQLKLILSCIRISATGADGGHIYLHGKSTYQNVGDTDVYAFFPDKQEERKFKDKFTGQNVMIVTKKWDFTKGMGVSAYISEWDFI